MSNVPPAVSEALERWEEKALLTPELADRLRREAAEASLAGTARLGQYVVAATGAVVTVIAGALFLQWAWPRMDAAAHTWALAAVGLAVHLWGVRLETKRRWVPAALLMQTAGLGLLLSAAIYSDNAWADATPGGIAAGIVALAVPFVLGPWSLGRNVAMPAVHLAFAFGFIAVFLDRATPLSADAIVWVLDGVLAAVAIGIVVLLRGDPAGRRHPWVLNAFVMAIYAAAVLAFFTALGPMDAGAGAAYPLDVWLILVVALTLWGIHRAPEGLRRDWFEAQLAWCLLLWIPLGFFTVMEAMKAPSEVALVFVGGAAVLGFGYAIERRVRAILGTSAIAFIAAVWIWATDRAGALGAVAGLAFAAVLLFWLSGRVGEWTTKGGAPRG
ncbi:MAG TPA: hypothetical protein VLH75_15795 [Longimicrobiales bacterium]|nr:hypothetical protein [Longimicrobiales bacterium]